jgi:hypothetical protein
MAGPVRIQLQIALPYRDEPRRHPAIRRYLDAGYTISQLLRASDKEALVTLAPPAGPPGTA